MTRTQRENAYAILFLIAWTPFYALRHPSEVRRNWRNGR